MSDIYINSNLNPLTKFTSSSRTTRLKDILPWSISQMITKTISICTIILINYATKWGIPLWIWWKIDGNWGNSMVRISQWRESHCRINSSVRRKKEIQKSRTMRIAVWYPSRKVNHLSKVIWDRKIITECTRWTSTPRIGVLVHMMDIKVSKEKNNRRVDREKLVYVRWNRIKNSAQRHWVK